VNNVVKVPQPNELGQFINFLFEGLEGYMYVVAKEAGNPDSWDQAFYEYPLQMDHAIQMINKISPKLEVYIGPVLYNNNQNAKKENVKCTQVVWCDFDGNKPDSFDIPPSLSIRTSEPGHEHTYWKLDTPLYQVSAIEDYNRRLCYKYGADLSGWDAVQVLRPPYTSNHKRHGLPVTIVETSSYIYNQAVLDTLAPAPEKSVDYSLWEKIDLPSINDVIYQHKFGPEFKQVFELTKEEVWDNNTQSGVRSTKLAQMAYICAEAGLNDKEIYVIISHLATRWGKFEHHTTANRSRQLIAIIEYARIKYPHSAFDDSGIVFAYSPKTLFEADITVEWAVEGLLMKKGVMLLAGPGGIGKTQLSMQFAFHLAAGKDFLHYPIPEPRKVGLFSLEMGDVEVKSFLTTMYPRLKDTFSDEEIERLNQNCIILPFGEALPLNTTVGQSILMAYQEEYKFDGIFIDSVGSAVLGNVNSSEVIQGLTNFNDRFRNRNDCFLWYIHHMRKAQPGQSNYGTGDDVYGDVYLTNRSTSVYTVTRTKSGLLRVRNTKNRHAIEEEPYLLRRELGLTFSHQGIEAEVMPEETTSATNALTKALQADKGPVDLTPMPFKKD
jgi:hypothetical protein